MTLRTKLVALFGASALLVSAFVGVFAYRGTDAELLSSTDDFLEVRADEVTSGLRSGPGNGRNQRNDTSDTLRDAADDDSIIQVTGPAGRTVSTGEALPAPDGKLGYRDIEIDGEPFRVFATMDSNDTLIQVARSTEENSEVLSALVARFGTIALIATLIAAAIGWYVASRVTSPLRRLAAVANDVASTRDFSAVEGITEADRSDEIGSLSQSFRSMLDALEASRTQQHRLIHDAGHELRTPLTSMRANIDLLGRARDLPEPARIEIVGAIKSELVELTELFNEMVDLATDQESAPMSLQPLQLDEVVEPVVERWRRRSRRDIGFHVVQPVEVSVDRAMIERAVSNLLSNATKFSPTGSSIDVVVDGATVCVRDGGPGIAAAERELVLERFHRSAATRSMPGSGLGLSIVAQIAERHGAEVWISDAPSGGAEVGIKFA